tara:strand:- start:6653 stop:8578 length:1926 start_codon:yes stop_codon:yes gene_type:complete
MLNTKKDRLDYGQELAPPEGYIIDAAVATTYSLDLNALLAVPIALCFNNTLEGDLKGEKLALLEAMAQLKGKLKVFYQKGNIHYPANFNRLFTLLEPCLQAVVPAGGAFSSFHPKLWLLRYIKAGEAKKPKVKYRLLVLSRNLTFDRSWDVALSLDGEIDKKNANGKQESWQALFEELLGQCDDFEVASILLRELPLICWDIPKPFDQLELRAGGLTFGNPVVSKSKVLTELLVVSPFVKSSDGDIKGLQQLLDDKGVEGRKYLCSRAEELNAIGAEALQDWDCYAINPTIVDGEEALALNDGNLDEVQSQNLHAKLIVREYGCYCDWLLGSANATSAALGQKNVNPRNTEVMVELSGRKKVMRPQQLLDDWLEQRLFVAHNFEPITIDASESLVATLRQLTHTLVKADWVLTASLRTDDNGYDLALEHDVVQSNIPDVAKVSISQLDLPGIFDLAECGTIPMLWEKASLSQLTAFIVVDIEIVKGELKKSSRCLISANLNIEGGDLRQQHLLQSLVDTPEKILNYVRLLLLTQPDKSQWLGFELGDEEEDDDTGVKGSVASLLFAGEPLFEQLMIASARHPEVIIRIEKLMARLRESEVVIPDDLQELWKHFSNPESLAPVMSGARKRVSANRNVQGIHR